MKSSRDYRLQRSKQQSITAFAPRVADGFRTSTEGIQEYTGVVFVQPGGGEMPGFKTFAAALLTGSALLAAAAFAQSIGGWTTGAPMSSARTEVAVGEVGGKIYVVGGFRGERDLEIYDPATDRWSRGASLPRALHHAGAVGLNGKLYVIGGFVEGWTPTDDVHEYDPASDRWQRLAALPTPRGALAAAVLDGKI
jgi:hypothetical protein